MRILTCMVFVFLAACGPQPGLEPTQVEYKITPQKSGFQIEISHNGRYLDKQGYFATPKQIDSVISDTYIDLAKGYFQTLGRDFIKCVGVDPAHKKSIRIIWDAPGDWKFATSFGEQTFEASCNELRSALYVGGNSRKLTLQKTWFGTLASYGIFTPNLDSTLETNMKRVQKFWGSNGEPYHLVSVRNGENEGGTAQFRSFQLILKPKTDGLALDRLITHEYFHNWNGLKINQAPTEDPVGHLDIWWFVEGFTDYYAYLLTHATDKKAYLKSFENSEFKNIPLFELKRNYKNNHTYFHVPYIQGRRIAADFDKKINRHSGKRLENVMHDLIERSKDPAFLLTHENILNVICDKSYMPCDQARRLIQTYVINGRLLTPVTNPLI